ncbi:cytoplasmic protein [Cryptococcus neoformans Tu259-1]|uniref:Cytoplasmic protein n=1 Tax=Cryptococcus neoformans Tu259-1 TaxID=1230072 RepID=A0A854QGF1_CRYNE|nr:cytoplasmic protein [Cryptococcus neoformans var. grubii AD1-83a]OXG20666.1 cytoplasmic protein [Cryptococcus neoformans var. grubii Tu259-1]OXG59400.1 cytoplasmic protein [Cryptococcus neoformans var. grubii MW-RSA1955]OXG63393.1 cytoplasmic protein [Cryptococcus neoformans var. grubii c8]OXG64003.1 cytoplasmic protein [Cryptococcus neoformans var. grubii CHC193]OXH10585.1 cytoplasmic protein [Cryptococcus neoformans var. grubii A5-35-17]OXH12245.1 cytoplasmic protein [Cryptococcus neofor
MTHRSRSGGPLKKHGGKKQQTHTRKLHHPPPLRSETPPLPVPDNLPLPPAERPFNPPDSELLALIHRALHSTLSSDEFQPTIQKIKGLLYDKKWLEVFCGPEGLLESYAGRWVPSRAACFRELMGQLVGEVFDGEGSVDQELGKLSLEDESDEDEEGAEEEGQEEVMKDKEESGKVDKEASGNASPAEKPAHHILSLGGGAGSELLAISALIRSTLLTRPRAHPSWTWTGIDIGNWHNVLKKLEGVVRMDWEITEDMLEVEYVKGDLMASIKPAVAKEGEIKDGDGEIIKGIASGPIDLKGLLTRKSPALITLFFTLAELLTQSRPLTLSLLATLTAQCKPGTLFLIADSASDISEFAIGAEGRKWPAWMVVDAVLTGKGKGWEKVRGEDSRWFRFEEGVGAGWACKLENTRYWYRLYRRM